MLLINRSWNFYSSDEITSIVSIQIPIMKKRFTLILLCFNSILFAQNNISAFDSIMNAVDKHQKFMGAVSLCKNGNVIYSRAVGFSSIENKRQADAQTLYHIGSITKMFTSVIVHQLLEEGKLKNDTKLSAFFPMLPNADKITIAQLLNHSSGLFNFTRDSNYLSLCSNFHSNDSLLRMFSRFKPSFQPGEKNDYSNTGYVLLSMIIEAVSKHPLQDEIENRISAPLQLRNTSISPAIKADQRIASSYSRESDRWLKEIETDMSIPQGAGAMISTPVELCTFITQLFQGRLLTDSGLKSMTTMERGYGRGIFQFPYGKRITFGHTGGIDGFVSMLAYFPDDSVSVAITSNGIDMNKNDLLLALLGVYYKKPYVIPGLQKPTLSAASAKSIFGKYHNSQIGMTITISEKDSKVIAQAEDQDPIVMEKVSDLEYEFKPEAIKITFKKDSKGEMRSFVLTQGRDINFEKIE